MTYPKFRGNTFLKTCTVNLQNVIIILCLSNFPDTVPILEIFLIAAEFVKNKKFILLNLLEHVYFSHGLLKYEKLPFFQGC